MQFFLRMHIYVDLPASIPQDQNEELSSEVKKLFEEYNKMVSLITVKDILFPVIIFLRLVMWSKLPAATDC